MPRISIDLDGKMFKALKKRADKNFLSVREMVYDIIRRSMVNYTGGKQRRGFRVDDRLVEAFSRDKRGRKKRR